MGRSDRDECRSSTRTNRLNMCDTACSSSLGVCDTRRARRAVAPRCCSSSSERRVVADTAGRPGPPTSVGGVIRFSLLRGSWRRPSCRTLFHRALGHNAPPADRK
eukprot:904068-Pyramimonas_sp.AAC.1